MSSGSLSSYYSYLAGGLAVTWKVFGLGTLVWLPSSFILALGRTSKHALVRLVAGFVVEMFRGTSALVQLFWAFYVLPLLGVHLSAITAAVLVLGLNEGSYGSEIVRGALAAVGPGQHEAATMLGLGPIKRLRLVILPQAVATMIPSLGNCAIDFLQFTSFVSLVTVLDVTARANLVNQQIGHTTALFSILLGLYFAGTLLIGLATRGIEWLVRRKWGIEAPERRRSIASQALRLGVSSS